MNDNSTRAKPPSRLFSGITVPLSQAVPWSLTASLTNPDPFRSPSLLNVDLPSHRQISDCHLPPPLSQRRPICLEQPRMPSGRLPTRGGDSAVTVSRSGCDKRPICAPTVPPFRGLRSRLRVQLQRIRRLDSSATPAGRSLAVLAVGRIASEGGFKVRARYLVIGRRGRRLYIGALSPL